MGTIQQKLAKLAATKEAIRQAIIAKGQSLAANAPFSSYPGKIAAITTGIDTSDATAAAGDILADKTAYVNGEKVTGTIPSKTVSDITQGVFHYGGQFSPTGYGVQLSAGYYPSMIKFIGDEQSEKTWTPTTANQTIASGRYLTGTQTIKGDANLVAENIKSGVSIFGVNGTADVVKNATITFRNSGDSDGYAYILPLSPVFGEYFCYFKIIRVPKYDSIKINTYVGFTFIALGSYVESVSDGIATIYGWDDYDNTIDFPLTNKLQSRAVPGQFELFYNLSDIFLSRDVKTDRKILGVFSVIDQGDFLFKFF